MGRLSTLEGDASDLQTAVDALSANKQDTITNAPVSEGQAVLGGSVLNKIGVKDDTLLIETTGNVIKLGGNKDNIQEKLIAIANASTTNNTSKAVLSNATVRSIWVENITLNITEANNVINLVRQD